MLTKALSLVILVAFAHPRCFFNILPVYVVHQEIYDRAMCFRELLRALTEMAQKKEKAQSEEDA